MTDREGLDKLDADLKRLQQNREKVPWASFRPGTPKHTTPSWQTSRRTPTGTPPGTWRRLPSPATRRTRRETSGWTGGSTPSWRKNAAPEAGSSDTGPPS